MNLLNAAEASWGLYQLIFVVGALLALYSLYSLYEASRFKDMALKKRARLLLMLAIVSMIATALVSYILTGKLPF